MNKIRELKTREQLTDKEVEQLDDLSNGFSGGFCIGGHALSDRVPKAFQFTYSADEVEPSGLEEIAYGEPQFWGQPNMLRRLTLGIDFSTFNEILHAKCDDGTPMWKGDIDDLVAIVVRNKLARPNKHLPIREAIDWVHSSIYTTIKAMKFANLPPVCGGPIEIAVITSDRPFRWVRHKDFDAVIGHLSAKDYRDA
jgi:hypothetical protein